MKFHLLLLALTASLSAFAQVLTPTNVSLARVERIVLPALDNKVLRQAELDRRQNKLNAAPQFAKAIELNINPLTNGTWETLKDGNLRWRLRIYSKDAYSLNLGFSQYQMPKGGSLLLYSPNGTQVLGPFTTSDNEDHAKLWTPLVKGDEIVLEVQIPAEQKNNLKLELKTVNHDFLNFLEIQAGACHLDAVCNVSNGWGIVDKYRDVIQSVATYGFEGTTYCTGFLVNNTQNDCTPYFITANHCGVTAENAASMVVYWNYQNSTCRDLRPAGGGILGDGNTNNFNTGAIFRAAYALTDVTLLELDDAVNDTANAFFAGWNRSFETPKDTVALIHHPDGTEKRLSFEFNGVYRGAWGNGESPVAAGEYLIVNSWDIGASEAGSSGAPLFDKNKRYIGQLRGGSANCGIPGFDAFGWVAPSWEGGGTKATRLRDWLDPSNSEILTIDGKGQAGCSFVLDVSNPIQNTCAPAAATFTINVNNQIALPIQLSIEGLPASANATFSQNPATPGTPVTLTVNTTALPNGKYNLVVTGTDGSQMTKTTLTLLVSTGGAPTVTLQTPRNGADRISLFPNFIWMASATGLYQFQIAKDSSFNTPTFSIDSLNNANLESSLRGVRLEGATTYFWRVRATNTCGQGAWSSAARFVTADVACATVSAAGVVEISDLIATTISDSLAIQLPGSIVDVRVNNLDIRHEWVGDLQVSLTSPAGTSVRLFDRPGVPNDQFGCEGQNVKINFNETAANTATQLETTCNENPAIAGDYRPLDPFTLLAGERAQGQWKLTIEDFESGDGGALRSWNLEVCAARPKDVFITTEKAIYSLCANDSLTFKIAVGREFNPTGVQLSLQNNPQGSIVNFSKNPAAPGDTIQVSVKNLNTNQDSTYNLTLLATDGTDTARTNVQVKVSRAVSRYALQFPNNNSQNIAVNTALEWEAASGAAEYIVTLLKAPNTLVLTDTIETNSYPIRNLSLGTDYRWFVKAVSACGESVSDTFTFKTIPDLSFSATPALVNACPPDRPSYGIFVGPGFNRPATVSYTVEPQVTLPIMFSVNANDVPLGTTIRANFGSLANVPSGEYKITFKVSDGTYNMADEVTFVLRGTPQVTTQILPADGAAFPDQAPVLNWKKANDATRYRVEIATSDNFSNIVRMATVTDTFYKVEPRLGGGVFHWRLTSLNDCGFSTSGISDFAIQAAGVHEWQGQQVTIAPNPTSGVLNIRFARMLSSDLNVEVFSLNGQLLQKSQFDAVGTELLVDLSNYAAGVYLIRLINDDAALTERIVLQK